MRVAVVIGLLMMNAMHRDPENRAALKRQGAADREEVFQPDRALVSAVRVQTVVSHADPETSSHPVKEERNQEAAPAEHEQRGECADVKQPDGNYDGPVQTFGPGQAEGFSSSLGSC